MLSFVAEQESVVAGVGAWLYQYVYGRSICKQGWLWFTMLQQE
jgi:hypothetical protein